MEWNDLVSALRREGLLLAATDAAPSITGLSLDTRAFAPGNLYCAVRGTTSDGHQFVPDALRAGAAALMVEAPMDAGVPELVVRVRRLRP